MNTQPEPLERVKCYADAPDGIKNKYLVYKSWDLDHSVDILNRLVAQGWKVRAAFHQFANGKASRIPDGLITGDTSNDYKARNVLASQLDEYDRRKPI